MLATRRHQEGSAVCFRRALVASNRHRCLSRGVASAGRSGLQHTWSPVLRGRDKGPNLQKVSLAQKSYPSQPSPNSMCLFCSPALSGTPLVPRGARWGRWKHLVLLWALSLLAVAPWRLTVQGVGFSRSFPSLQMKMDVWVCFRPFALSRVSRSR